MDPLKCIGIFRRTLEMLLIHCQISLILTWSKIALALNQVSTFRITDTKLFVLVVTLWTQDNGKILKQMWI